MKKTVTSLNKKSWYRFLKVVYILSFVIILLFGILLCWFETMPKKKIINNEKTEIICKYGNREIFNIKEKGIYLSFSEFENKKIDSYEEEKIMKDCEMKKENILTPEQAKDKILTAYRDAKANPDNPEAQEFIAHFKAGHFDISTGKLKPEVRLKIEAEKIHPLIKGMYDQSIANPDDPRAQQFMADLEAGKWDLKTGIKKKTFDELNALEKQQVKQGIEVAGYTPEDIEEKQKNRKIKGELFENDYYDIDFVTKNKGGFFVFLGYLILSVIGIFIVFEITKRTFYYIVLGSINPEK